MVNYSAPLDSTFSALADPTRRAILARLAWGDKFSLMSYHDKLLSFGSPPVRFTRALLLNLPIPE